LSVEWDVREFMGPLGMPGRDFEYDDWGFERVWRFPVNGVKWSKSYFDHRGAFLSSGTREARLEAWCSRNRAQTSDAISIR